MESKIKIGLRLLSAVLAVVFLASCTTTSTSSTPYSSSYDPVTNFSVRGNVYHSVAPGETLWRIGKMYDVDAETLRRVNKIRNVNDMDIGTKLYIPNASTRKHVISLYPNNKWDYIIVHHSATDFGSAAEFNKAHLRRGWRGVGYHFIIDNGTCGKADGQIETTHRWINQMDGAHCKANNMNTRGIGICIVGNFSEDAVSRNQMNSLVFLTKKLQRYYRIPDSKVLGHGQVHGAQTECPGKHFPWKTFKSKIARAR